MRRIGIALVVACALASAVRAEEPSTIPGPRGFHFPARIGGLDRVDLTVFDSEGRNVGASYDATDGLRVSLYVYPADPLCGRSLETELGCVVAAIRMKVPSAQIEGVTTTTVPLAGAEIPALLLSARFVLEDQISKSAAVVAHLGDQLVKVRATWPDGALATGAVWDTIRNGLAEISSGFASRPSWAEDEARVRQALAIISGSPPGRDLRALFHLVAEFAEQSPRVDIVLDTQYVPMQEGAEACNAILLGHYLAGAVGFDLDHPDEASDARADVVAAWEAVLRYHSRLSAGQGCSTPLVERAAALQREGRLASLVESPPAAPAP